MLKGKLNQLLDVWGSGSLKVQQLTTHEYCEFIPFNGRMKSSERILKSVDSLQMLLKNNQNIKIL